MRRTLVSVVFLLMCLGALSACDIPLPGSSDTFSASSTTPASTIPLSGTSWALSRLIVAGRIQTLAPTAPVTLQFQRSENTYMGSSGCNYYNGAYAVSGDQLHLQFGIVTQRACAGPIMSQEVTYLNAMNLLRRFQTNQKTLTLNDSDGKPILVYTSA